MNVFPERVNVNITKVIERVLCPVCNTMPRDTKEVIQDCISGGYYNIPHIPPRLTFTCDNPECIACDEDFEMVLMPVVLQVAKVQLKEW